jgi:dihydrolipoamide dehydrogenase
MVSMSRKIVVIGAGPGGYVAALRAASLGAEVTLVEKEEVGGTCLNWGCIPSKIMKTTADLYLRFRDAENFGIVCQGDPHPDMRRLMQRKQRVIETQRQGIHALLKKSSVRFVRGRGTVKEQGLVCAASGDGTVTEIPFDRLILAVGTEPLALPGLPFDGRRVLSSNHLLCLEEIPGSLVIVGGGVIGCEFAFILGALGSRVTVVEALDRPLPLDSVDESCSKVLAREMKKSRIACITNRAVSGCSVNGEKLRVTLGGSPFDPLRDSVKEQVVEADVMAVCVGRAPFPGIWGWKTWDSQPTPGGGSP